MLKTPLNTLILRRLILREKADAGPNYGEGQIKCVK